MYTKQVSVFLSNEQGRLATLTRLLTEAGINIRALSLAENADFGVLRLIVSDRPRCMALLKEHGFAAQETDVIAVQVDDQPGGLYRIVETLNGRGLNIEYLYAFFTKSGDKAVVVMKIDHAEQAVDALARNSIFALPDDVLQDM
jgi:hypothetical protein